MRQKALEAGACILTSGPEGLQETPQGWTLKLQEGTEIHARCVLDATGRQAWVARQLGIKRHSLDAQVALYREVDSTDGPPWIQVTAVEEGWWYISQLPHARSEMFFTLPESPAYLEKIHQGGWKVAPASVTFLSQVAGERWLAVGDAAFTFDPIASQGISQALASGYYAACAARDLLQGRKEAILAYTLTLLKATEGFFREWAGIYQAEQRFGGSIYWQQRHNLRSVQLPWWQQAELFTWVQAR
ncbi:hypothetical protein DC3_02080 [Deinococcus cellulosilyticus NBRC 106333 = KACC 11606]|uniref:Uncharacterized protein n=1 Tax=Deinococcus cellulosilyticus (strain DSM 18568 / NBRC 106333 / KACC 11606 / 5516J-15) TaxID=1223518 RepID=A0A511MVG7_DEIC1|nr:hypothetical protein DC3_02080 [Deinococcus cellulosilyticus NBRC 106333 = KACC 11606]